MDAIGVLLDILEGPILHSHAGTRVHRWAQTRDLYIFGFAFHDIEFKGDLALGLFALFFVVACRNIGAFGLDLGGDFFLIAGLHGRNGGGSFDRSGHRCGAE